MLKFIKNIFKNKQTNDTNNHVLVMTEIRDGITYKTFVVPVGKISAKTAENNIKEFMKDMHFNNTTGSINVDGINGMPYLKEYWLPTQDNDVNTNEISELIADYKSDVNFDERTGSLVISSKHMPNE